MFENVTETEWAYIAGIIDGEGCLGVYHRSSRNKGTRQVIPSTSYRPRIQVVNTNLNLVLWIRDRLKGDIATYASHDSRRKTKYVWRNGAARSILSICEHCLPYLVIKRKQAELVLRFPVDAVCNQWTVEETRRIKIEKHNLYEETLRLNRRGQLVQ